MMNPDGTLSVRPLRWPKNLPPGDLARRHAVVCDLVDQVMTSPRDNAPERADKAREVLYKNFPWLKDFLFRADEMGEEFPLHVREALESVEIQAFGVHAARPAPPARLAPGVTVPPEKRPENERPFDQIVRPKPNPERRPVRRRPQPATTVPQMALPVVDPGPGADMGPDGHYRPQNGQKPAQKPAQAPTPAKLGNHSQNGLPDAREAALAKMAEAPAADPPAPAKPKKADRIPNRKAPAPTDGFIRMTERQNVKTSIDKADEIEALLRAWLARFDELPSQPAIAHFSNSKGREINVALGRLKKEGWKFHFDVNGPGIVLARPEEKKK